MQILVDLIEKFNNIEPETLWLLVYLVVNMVTLPINLMTWRKCSKLVTKPESSSETSAQQFVLFLETTMTNLLEAFKTVPMNQSSPSMQLESSQKLEISQELAKVQEIMQKIKEVTDNEQKHEQ